MFIYYIQYEMAIEGFCNVLSFLVIIKDKVNSTNLIGMLITQLEQFINPILLLGSWCCSLVELLKSFGISLPCSSTINTRQFN